ncbi:MAG: hypothetical protein DRH32_03170 [Deltaproteobacteria bacterium]|nr:MAG: hypothetical protein DRH32_03170 [Deltaproteobacteria bacterium]
MKTKRDGHRFTLPVSGGEFQRETVKAPAGTKYARPGAIRCFPGLLPFFRAAALYLRLPA